MGAILSDDGLFRYRLWRDLAYDDGPPNLIDDPPPEPAGTMVFIMLNPSTADAELDDPTITRCIGFAKRERCARLEVVNLIPYRATEPEDMIAWCKDPANERMQVMQRGNVAAMLDATADARMIVAAWGSSAPFLTDLFIPHAKGVAERAGLPLLHLGMNLDGNPKHPLYRPANHPLNVWWQPS